MQPRRRAQRYSTRSESRTLPRLECSTALEPRDMSRSELQLPPARPRLALPSSKRV